MAAFPRRATASCIVIGIVVAFAVVIVPSAKAAQTSGPLVVDATMARSVFTANEDIAVRLRLKNIGQAPLFLKPPYSIGPGDSRTTIRFLIERDGKTIDSFSSRLTGGLSGNGPDSITLRAGERSDFYSFGLSDSVQFVEKVRYDHVRHLGRRLPPGSYTMKVKYSFTAEQANLNHDPEWIGEAVSVPLKFTVKGRAVAYSKNDSWSPMSGGLRGRLSLKNGAETNGSRPVDVYMELENGEKFELTFAYRSIKPMIVCDLRDSDGRLVPRTGDVYKNSAYAANSVWPLPPEGSVRLKVSVNTFEIPKDVIDIQMPCGHWALKRADKRRYFLEASLIAPPQPFNGKNVVWWFSALDFPAVEIPK